MIIELDKLLNSGYNNFLIVQPAGNGLSLTKDEFAADKKEKDEKGAVSKIRGVEAEYTGFFANINHNTYRIAQDQLAQNKKQKNDLNHSIETILSHIIVVGGVNEEYESPSWASYGNPIDIAAPAENLEFIGEDGTSYAAPMVSAAAALVWGYTPELNAEEVKQTLIDKSLETVSEAKGDKSSYPMLNVMSFLSSEDKYSDLMETYRTAVKEQWGPEQLDNRRLGPEQYVPGSLRTDYGYTFYDINKDGIEEMILGVMLDDSEQAYIQEIYTLVDWKPFKVFESATRRSAFVCKNGTLRINEVIDMGTGEIVSLFSDDLESLATLENLYELEGKDAKVVKEGYIENMSGQTYRSLKNSQILSKENVDEINKQYETMDELIFTPFLSE